MFAMIYFPLIRNKIFMTKKVPYISTDKLPDKYRITNIDTFKSHLKNKSVIIYDSTNYQWFDFYLSSIFIIIVVYLVDTLNFGNDFPV